MLRFIFKWGLLLTIWLLIGAMIMIFYYFRDLPNLSDLETQDGKQVIQVDYSNKERITNFGEIYSSKVNFYELPSHLVDAVVATEDRRFFNHHGVDVFGIIRAFIVNHKAGHIVQGGSTITQQLAKLLFLKPERTFKRKMQEMLLAVQLERSFTKDQIMTLYLNRAYFGSGNYGVGNAAKFYFGKKISEINLNEAALLAGLLKAPSKLSPKNNQELAESRTNVVLNNMIDAGFLSKKNLKEVKEKVNYADKNRSSKLYFADFIHEQFSEFLPGKFLDEKRLAITTTLDEKLQDNLDRVLNEFTEKNSKKLGKSQVAVIVMAKDGAVLGMSGGVDYQKSQFNRAVYSKRQSGSAFKTIIYLSAFERGFKPDDVFEDRKINVGAWLPENYDNQYLGEVTLKQAFAKSLNSVAVQLSQKIDRGEIIKMAQRLGISSKIDKDDPTIALGTTGLTLFELTTAYATIANDGEAIIPYYINKISDSEGNALYERESSGLGVVISDDAQKYIKEVLREVVVSGTGKLANIDNDVYGKTGTSQNFRDAWFVGFNDKYVVGVWIGNDDNSPTNKITGGSLPASLFAEILEKI